MDLINKVKEYFQKVEVVNELKARIESSETDPLTVVLPTSYVAGGGSSPAIRVSTNTGNWLTVRPSGGSNLNLHVSSVHVVSSGFGYIFPIDLWVYNLTASAVSNNVSAVYSSYTSRFSSADSVVIFYETYNLSGTVTATSYSSTD